MILRVRIFQFGLFLILFSGFFGFVKSQKLNSIVQNTLIPYFEKKSGMKISFTALSLELFPTRISIQNFKMFVPSSVVSIFPDQRVEENWIFAEKINFQFHPFSLLLGKKQVSQIELIHGQIEGTFRGSPADLATAQSSHNRLDQVIAKNILKFVSSSPIQIDSLLLKDFRWILRLKCQNLFRDQKSFVSSLRSISGTLDCHLQQKKRAWISRSQTSASAFHQTSLNYQMHLKMTHIESTPPLPFLFNQPIENVEMDLRVSLAPLQSQMTSELSEEIVIERLFIASHGIESLLQGEIHGPLFLEQFSKNFQDTVVNGTIQIKGELQSLHPVVQRLISSKTFPVGHLQWSGKIGGKLENFPQNIKASGKIIFEKFKYQHWKADRMEAAFEWVPSLERDVKSGQWGTLICTEGYVQAALQERLGGHQAGEGGRIEVMGPVQWVIGSAAPVELPLKFHQVHLHWLGASQLSNLYPLDFRINGVMTLKGIPPLKGKGRRVPSIQAQMNIGLENFQFDNQRHQQTRPIVSLFQVPRIGLIGKISVNSSEIQFISVDLQLPNTHLQSSGKINFKTGCDFQVQGMAQLEDLNQIAHQPIQGQGGVKIHVHGLSTALLVDIDVDVKNAAYLKLLLGNIKGRMTWSDGPSQLLFQDLQVNKNATLYTVNGLIDFQKEGQINLQGHIVKGYIQDLIQIFNTLHQSFTWFPYAIKGAVQGDFQVKGGLQFNQLQILTQLEGKHWEYKGEYFKSVSLKGGYDRGKYFIQDYQVLKRSAHISGHLSFDSDQIFDWEMVTHSLRLSDFDHIMQWDVPIRGALSVKSQGTGKIGAFRSTTTVQLTDLSMRDTPLLESQCLIQTKNGVLYLQGSLLGEQGLINMTLDSNPIESSFVYAEFKQLDFSPFLLLFNSKVELDRTAIGSLSAVLNVTFRANQFKWATGMLSISEFFCNRGSSQFQLSKPVFGKIVNGSFQFQNIAIHGQTGELTLQLQNNHHELKGSLTGELDLSLLEVLTSSINQASGLAHVEVVIGGTLEKPTFLGQAILDGASFQNPALGSAFGNITGKLQLKQNSLNLQNLQADLGNGRVTVNGQVNLYAHQFPTLALKVNVKHSHLKIEPFQYIKVSGDLGIYGDVLPYVIDGNVMVESALLRENFFNQRQSQGSLKALQYSPNTYQQNENASSHFKLKVDVEAPREVWIQNDFFRDTHVKGHLTLVNTLEAPRVLGTAEVIQGKFLFKDHIFNIQSASAQFDSVRVVYPQCELNSSTEMNGVKIQLYATGRANQLKIELTSHPVMQEAEILSMLATGLTSSDAKKMNATDVDTVQKGEAASLVLHSLDFNRDLEDKTGFQLKLDETINRTQGTSVFRPQTQADSVATPQIVISRKINDRLSVSAGSTIGVGNAQSNQFNLDYIINPNLSVTGVVNSYGSTTHPANDIPLEQNSFGLDLKFKKRFR